MRILFMGTPDIAAQSLSAILAQGRHTVCAVFTREDKPVGRKQVLTAPPVKTLALEQGIPVYQPRTLRTPEAAQTVCALAPDIIVVVAYGRILPGEILSIPPHGAVNLHVSLLPKYRGAAPVQWSVINGDKRTGVTIMQLDEGLDTGDILRVAPVDIGAEETSGELFERVSALGAQTLLQSLDDIEQGRAQPVPQDDALATLAPPLTKEMALFSFERDARSLHDLIRGLNPWPVAYFVHGGKKIKVLAARLDEQAKGRPGEVLCTKPLTVACGSGAMDGAAWAAGRRLRAGDML